MRQFATITVMGRDNTGVIARVTAFLFEQRANLETPENQVTRGWFCMTLQTSWFASDCHAAGVHAGLDKLARQLRMEIKIRCFRPDRRQRFAIMATRESPDSEARASDHRSDLAPLAKTNCGLSVTHETNHTRAEVRASCLPKHRGWFRGARTVRENSPANVA